MESGAFYTIHSNTLLPQKPSILTKALMLLGKEKIYITQHEVVIYKIFKENVLIKNIQSLDYYIQNLVKIKSKNSSVFRK
jgi:hypothetical protein